MVRRSAVSLAGLLARITLVGLAWTVLGCERPPETSPYEPLPSTRGYVLLSIDTLRADRLGVYGHERDTSPRLDALAERGVVFEQAFAQAPSTLISHMSMLTGLYPREHGVIPPGNNVLSERVPILAELFRRAGFRTAGHTEGGYMHGAHGFARGFEVFSDDPFKSSVDVEHTYERGLAFLRSLGDDERFFLFLHTYTVHDPYFPPATYRGLYREDPPADPTPVSAEHLKRVNGGLRAPDPGEAELLGSQYDAGVRYYDDVLGRFLDRVRELGLFGEITWVITSDHGEELLEHGRLLHTQTYPEGLRVPLIVVHPASPGGRRVDEVVRSVDLAPTLWELAGIELPTPISGRSLVPYLAGAERVAPRKAYGEVAYLDVQRMLTAELDGELFQLVERRPLADPDGAWIHRQLIFDHPGDSLELKALSFHRPRTVEIEVDGRPLARLDLRPDRWTDAAYDLPAGTGPSRVRMRVDGCVSPKSLGQSDDYRCLGFKIADPDRRRLELFDLRRDPLGREDLSRRRPRILRRMIQSLDALVFTPVAPAGSRPPTEEERKALDALGYL